MEKNNKCYMINKIYEWSDRMELLIQNITAVVIVVFPMITLLAILLNVIKSHSITVITLVWSMLFSFIYHTSLLHSVETNMKSYVLWFELIKIYNFHAWMCLFYYLLIGAVAIKFIYHTIKQN